MHKMKTFRCAPVYLSELLLSIYGRVRRGKIYLLALRDEEKKHTHTHVHTKSIRALAKLIFM